MGNCFSTKSKGERQMNDIFDPTLLQDDQSSHSLSVISSIGIQPKESGTTSVSSSASNYNEMKTFDLESVKHALGTTEEFEEEEYDDDEDSEDEKASLSPKGRTAPSHAYTVPLPHQAPPNPLRKQSSSGKNFPKFKKPLSAIPIHLKMEGFSRQKHNSTSSLYINTTLSKPDTDEVLRCMAQAILYHIEKCVESPHKTFFEIFSEEKYPITKSLVDTRSMPIAEEIYQFISMIFKAERLDPECAIMCLAYIERIISLTGVTMAPVNWRRIVLSALILASKVWEDQSVWNVDFLPVFDNLTAADLNKLERQFLALLQYNVSLNASLYAKYYFELRTFSKLDPQNFPLQPLDKLSVMRLESHSQASEHRVRTFKRSASVDQLKPLEPHTPMVLN